MNDRAAFIARLVRLACLLAVAWLVMTLTHELGHVLGGLACGGKLVEADLVPWRLPYSIFNPDPMPLATLWSGPLLGVLAPLAVAMMLRRSWLWLIASFCLFANGMYLGIAWFTGDSHLDTAKLLQHGAWPVSVAGFIAATVVPGYLGLRAALLRHMGGDQHPPQGPVIKD